MTTLLDAPPYAERDEARFLAEMATLTRHHLAGCEPYARMWAGWEDAATVAELPWVHVGVFKHLDLRTETEGVKHQRTLESSATTSGVASRIALDAESSELQGKSSRAILADFVGEAARPLIVIDSVRSLRSRGGVSARVAAALSLQPFATDLSFVLGDAGDPATMRWEVIEELCASHEELLVYGFTWILWLAWGAAEMPASVRSALEGKTVHFVHSGGWKKLESESVDRAAFDAALLAGLSPRSRVVDYYGLVEQVGIVYPLCEQGLRHAPRWADVLVRDPHTLEALEDAPGQLQLMNLLARGAPYHSVLTEDLGRRVPGPCPCGRGDRRFELLGRIPKAEVRGCANV
jgi:hypothetical protein